MYEIEKVLADKALLKRLLEEHQMFREAIEHSPMQFCIYDAADNLVAWNNAYEEVHKQAFAEQRGAAERGELKYRDVIRYQMAETLSPEELEIEIERRVIDQRKANGMPVIRTYKSDEVLKVHKYRLPSGAVAGLAIDITDLKKREVELNEAKRIAEAAEIKANDALEAARIRQRQSHMLSELDEWLQCCNSLEELFDIVATFMSKLVPGSSGELYIFKSSRDVLEGSCSWNCDGPHDYIAPDSCWALRRGRPYEYGQGVIAFTCDHVKAQKNVDPEQKYLCLPIVAHGETVGLMHIKLANENVKEHAGEQVRRRISDVNEFAMQCAEHISLAIANIRLRDELRDQSIRDPLTGLFNRRYFMEKLRNEMARAHKKGDTVGLISFDADKFKNFNDNHGHDAGDMVLRAIGETLRNTFTKNEVLCRFGGEEFSVLIPSASIKKTEEEAERLRANIEAITIRYNDGDLPQVTISAGVAVFPQNGRFPNDLLKAADAALYTAKDEGRNRVIVGKAA